MRVEHLSSYGKAFDHMPLTGQLLQAKLFLSQLKAKFGFFGMLAFLRDTLRKRRELRKRHGATIERDFGTVPGSAIMELYMLASMYYVLAEREDEAAALAFIPVGPSSSYYIYSWLGSSGEPAPPALEGLAR